MSPDLRDAIHGVLRKQQWFSEYRREAGLPALDLISSATVDDDTAEVAESISETLDFEQEVRSRSSNPKQFLERFMAQCEGIDISVIRTAVVAGNTRRVLNVEEFRGFSLRDPYAPFVFINGSDSRAAQIFTLGHALGHLWLGQSGVSNVRAGSADFGTPNAETFCNQVAADLLLPESAFRTAWDGSASAFVAWTKVATISGRAGRASVVPGQRVIHFVLSLGMVGDSGESGRPPSYRDVAMQETQQSPRSEAVTRT